MSFVLMAASHAVTIFKYFSSRRGYMILILGRFQPLHKGHMKVIKDAFDEDKHITIAIGSAQRSDDSHNPLSGEERKRMLEAALKAEQIKARIVLVPDIPCDSTYVRHVEEMIGCKPDKIITENTWTIELYRKEGYDVHVTPRYFGISATDIRRRMVTGEEWESMVPEHVAEMLKKSGFVTKLRKLHAEGSVDKSPFTHHQKKDKA
jgi:nicotinamide-nucleotide adenylyltransferase